MKIAYLRLRFWPHVLIGFSLIACFSGRAFASVDDTYVSHSGLQLWLKADSLALVDGAAVSSWADQSGQGNDATQSTGTNQPTFVASGLNGKPTVHFTASAKQFLSVPDAAGLKPGQMTVIAVAKRATGGSNAAMICEKGNGTAGYSLRFSSGTKAAGYVNGNGTVTPSTALLTLGNFYLLMATYDQVANNLYQNGSLVDSNAYTTAITTYSNPLTIGGRSAANNLDGNIAELLVYDHALSMSDRQDIEAYLYAKYAVGSAPTPDAPAFSLNTGTYPNSQSVTLSTTTSGAAIYYTTDGSAPTTGSTPYTGPIPVLSTTTLTAVVTKPGYQNSASTIAVYTIDPATSLIPRSGLQLWLKADSLALTDGAAVSVWPDQSGHDNDALQATPANQPTYVASGLASCPTVHFTATAKQYLSVADTAGLKPAQLTMIAVAKRSAGTAVAMIAEKGNGTAGYALRFQTGTTVRGFINSNYTQTPAASALALGSFNVLTMTYDQVQNNLCQNATPVDSNAYATAIKAYANPMTIGGRTTSYNLDGDIAELLVYDHRPYDWELAKIYEYLYVKYQVGQEPTLPAPTFGKGDGTYVGAQTLAMSSYAGAAIYYTIDGSTPTPASTVYTGPITVPATATINAIAVKSLYNTSPVASVKLVITSSGLDVGDGLPSNYDADSNGNGIPDSVESAMGLDPSNTSNVVPGGENTFDYDKLHRITTGPGRTYNQDAESNITSQ